MLTPEILAALHNIDVAPIRRRWQPDVHQTIDVERALRRMLGKPDMWNDLRRLIDQLEVDIAAFDTAISDSNSHLTDQMAELSGLASTASNALTDAYTLLDRGDLELLRQQLSTNPPFPRPELVILPRRLRASRERAALTANKHACRHSEGFRNPQRSRCTPW